MKKICVIGANGFIGKKLCQGLSRLDISVRAVVRSINLSSEIPNVEYINAGDINDIKDWSKIFLNCDCVIHCVSIGHKIFNQNDEILFNYWNKSVKGISLLTRQAAENSVKRLIFLSTIKVNGEKNSFSTKMTKSKSFNTSSFTHNDIPKPEDFYGMYKLEMEKKLWEISSLTSLDIVVIRPPIVYGKNVKGNLEHLIKLIKISLPLPFSRIQNKRSMIGIDNLIDLLIRCINHPKAIGKTFLASDDKDLSTPALIELIASSFERKAYLFPVPLFLLKFLGLVFGKQKEINRLTGSLRIDNSYAKETLNWKPPISVEEGIRRMVQGK